MFKNYSFVTDNWIYVYSGLLLVGLYIREGYGQTETTLLAAMFKELRVKPGSFGKPAPGFDLQVCKNF